MKMFYVYIGVFVLIVALIILAATLPKKQTIDLNYNIKLAETGDKVTLDYLLTVDGNKIDSSYDRNQPFSFTIGSGQTIKGFDKGVIGMMEGQEKTIVVSPEDGYGSANEYPQKQNFDLNEVLTTLKEQTGQDLNVDQIQGGQFVMYGKNCMFDGYDINANIQIIACQHELAGKTLTFKLKLISIEKAKPIDVSNDQNIDLNTIVIDTNN
jgi:FKBP-type peptidyl-prolyl cis-trans isomerase 2